MDPDKITKRKKKLRDIKKTMELACTKIALLGHKRVFLSLDNNYCYFTPSEPFHYQQKETTNWEFMISTTHSHSK